MEILNIIYEYEFIQWILIVLLIVVLARGLVGSSEEKLENNIISESMPENEITSNYGKH